MLIISSNFNQSKFFSSYTDSICSRRISGFFLAIDDTDDKYAGKLGKIVGNASFVNDQCFLGTIISSPDNGLCMSYVFLIFLIIPYHTTYHFVLKYLL